MDGKFWGKVAISAAIFCLIIFALKTFSTSSNIFSILLPPITASTTAQKLLDSVILSHSEVAVQENGHFTRASFAITNNSNLDIKNIAIICTLMDNAGNEQGRNKWVLYDTIKAHAKGLVSHTSKTYVSDKASASQCQIVDMETVKAPLIAIHRGASNIPGEIKNTMHNGGTHH